MNNTTIKNNRNYKGDSLILELSDYTIIDLETTGLDPTNDNIIELSAIKVRNNNIEDTFQTLVNPEIEIDSFISSLTGITNEMVKNSPKIYEVINAFINFIGNDMIVGHNVNFDINFLYDNYYNITHNYLTNDFIDTLRISRKYVTDISNHKLETLANHFNIEYKNTHRALNDCVITNQLYNILKSIMKKRKDKISDIKIDSSRPILKAKCAIKGKTKNYSKEELIKICRNNKMTIHSFFYNDNYDYLILSNKKYKNYTQGIQKEYYENHGNKIISENEFYNLLGLPYNTKKKNFEHRIKAKDISSDCNDFDMNNPIFDKECVFTGKLDKMTRKEAMQIVADLGGKNRDSVTKETNYLILGNNDYCKSITDGKSSKQKKAESYKLKGQDIEILSEDVFYDIIDDYI